MPTPPVPLSPEELRRHATWLRGLAQRLVRGADEAEDLAQDVWVELATATGPVVHLRSFTARIARRLAARRRTSGRAREAREVRAAREERLPDPAELEEHLETQRLLFQELSALDEVHRRPLLLHFYEGLTAAEIARRSGAPETTVRSQIQRALRELRARLDRRHGGERALWVALLARLPEPDAATIALGGGSLALLGSAAAVAAIAGGLYFFGQDEPEPDAVLLASAPRDEGRAFAPIADAPPSTAPKTTPAPSIESAREPAAGAERPASANADVPLLVRDADSGDPLAEFLLELERSDGTREELTTDVEGRVTVPREWFESSFVLHARGDEEWTDAVVDRNVSPVDLPPDGEPLVVTCAVGPTYTLLFDGPAPEPGELFASLSRGTRIPFEFPDRASLHRDGARMWTRFAPNYSVRSPKGDEPWTLAVFAEDGLWRASGTVATLRGVQAEPVWLAAEACGVVAVRVESEGGPVVGECSVTAFRMMEGKPVERWTLYALAGGGQSTVGGMPQGSSTGVRTVRFEHLVPGTYRVRAGSAAHEGAQRELVVTAAAVSEVALDIRRRTDLAELRVVITSETGTLPLPPIGVKAREIETNTWRQTRWLPESTYERRVVTLEGTKGAEVELTIDGFESLGTLEWSPGTTCSARPGTEVVFTALDAGRPPVRRASVSVVSNGAPVRDAGVTTYFGSEASFLHETDADGRVELEPIQEGASFSLVVIADGYRPRVLRELELTRDGESFEVSLTPGWGVWLDVVLEATRSTTVGGRAVDAQVLVDGVDAGRTDELGQILLEGDAAPRTIEVVYPGYHIAYGSIDPATFAPHSHANGTYWVVLRSDEP